jgi:hypothetical protein
MSAFAIADLRIEQSANLDMVLDRPREFEFAPRCQLASDAELQRKAIP